ncbi:transcriptional regulator [Acinetobacter defluvii]|uniref:TetR/AcrR family transcriptional regulator n=1 Tax=Acinetobacter defluvii TaxID=1871111 RepID=UPI001490474E|nr:TetR/AcrR family transcriptional regulator [Acinetobacter defluvii]NNP71680.1 transcriptional regulator [Acinetobacter defluvii]
MRYKANYKQQKRQELLAISGQLAKKNGFQTTGVDSFMKAAGVTSGAFYSHFSSKNELFKALLENELQRSVHLWQKNPHDELAAWVDFELERYLSEQHLNHPDQGCILPTLATEVARADNEIKLAYQQELIRGYQLFEQHLGDAQLAWGFMTQLVGAILLARSMLDDNIRRSILESSKYFIHTALKQHQPQNEF